MLHSVCPSCCFISFSNLERVLRWSFICDVAGQSWHPTLAAKTFHFVDSTCGLMMRTMTNPRSRPTRRRTRRRYLPNMARETKWKHRALTSEKQKRDFSNKNIWCNRVEITDIWGWSFKPLSPNVLFRGQLITDLYLLYRSNHVTLAPFQADSGLFVIVVYTYYTCYGFSRKVRNRNGWIRHGRRHAI